MGLNKIQTLLIPDLRTGFGQFLREKRRRLLENVPSDEQRCYVAVSYWQAQGKSYRGIPSYKARQFSIYYSQKAIPQ